MWPHKVESLDLYPDGTEGQSESSTAHIVPQSCLKRGAHARSCVQVISGLGLRLRLTGWAHDKVRINYLVRKLNARAAMASTFAHPHWLKSVNFLELRGSFPKYTSQS